MSGMCPTCGTDRSRIPSVHRAGRESQRPQRVKALQRHPRQVRKLFVQNGPGIHAIMVLSSLQRNTPLSKQASLAPNQPMLSGVFPRSPALENIVPCWVLSFPAFPCTASVANARARGLLGSEVEAPEAQQTQGLRGTVCHVWDRSQPSVAAGSPPVTWFSHDRRRWKRRFWTFSFRGFLRPKTR